MLLHGMEQILADIKQVIDNFDFQQDHAPVGAQCAECSPIAAV